MKKRQIFIIEDDEITVTQISYFLKLRGFEVIGQAFSGEEAIHRVVRSRPDAILVDINLSGKLDGVETVNFIYREFNCPIIYITSDDDPLTLERIMTTRPYGFLKKPLRFDALCNTLELAIEKYETENKLKENESLFSLIVNSLKDYLILMIHPNGNLISWNEGLEKMFGYKDKELDEMNFLNFLSENSEQEKNYFDEMLRIALNQGKYSTDLWLRKKNSEIFLTDTTFTPVRDKDNILKGFSIIIRDITEKQKMEEERLHLQNKLKKYNAELEHRVQERTAELKDLNEKLQKEIRLNQIFEKQLLKSQKNLLEARKLARIGDWEISFETKEVGLSPEIYKILGIHPDDNPPSFEAMLEIISPEKKEDHKQYILERLEKQSELNFDKLIQMNNRTIYVNIFLKPVLENSEIVGLFGTIHDITIRRKAIEETEKALQKERELNRMKNKFVSMMTHEFRTPLTVIQSNAQLLERFSGESSQIEISERFAKIYKACQKMNDLMDEILRYGKLRDVEIVVNRQEFSLLQFAKTIQSELEYTESGADRIIIENHIEFDNIFLDQNLLGYILTNLLVNALKFSPPEMKVFLSLYSTKEQISIQVKDFGIGIPAGETEQIFLNFYRASNAKTIRGTGLGLSLVREYTHAMNGNIQVRSVPGVETTFEVIFPR